MISAVRSVDPSSTMISSKPPGYPCPVTASIRSGKVAWALYAGTMTLIKGSKAIQALPDLFHLQFQQAKRLRHAVIAAVLLAQKHCHQKA